MPVTRRGTRHKCHKATEDKDSSNFTHMLQAMFASREGEWEDRRAERELEREEQKEQRDQERRERQEQRELEREERCRQFDLQMQQLQQQAQFQNIFLCICSGTTTVAATKITWIKIINEFIIPNYSMRISLPFLTKFGIYTFLI